MIVLMVLLLAIIAFIFVFIAAFKVAKIFSIVALGILLLAIVSTASIAALAGLIVGIVLQNSVTANTPLLTILSGFGVSVIVGAALARSILIEIRSFTHRMHSIFTRPKP